MSSFKKINDTTYSHVFDAESIETVVGDEKQKEFLPRVKLKKWENEVNFSIGLAGANNGKHKVNNQKITYSDGPLEAIFEPVPIRQFDTSSIRYINSGAISPLRISALYELDRNIEWSRQTINVHWSNVYAMLYYGYYPREKYIDPNKIDIPECRMSTWLAENGPMVMDAGLPLIDIHYDPKRDNLELLHSSMKSAIKSVLVKYGVQNISESPNGLKMYFTNQDGNKVKFFSTAFVEGHYYFYINFNTDYNASHNYYKAGVTPETADNFAYGLMQEYDLPEGLVDEIIELYADNYGLPLAVEAFTSAEEAELDRLELLLNDRNWIENGERNDPYYISSWEKNDDGFLFDFLISEKPTTNVINLTIEHKGIVMYRQTKDLQPGAWRSPRTIGSFVAYHAEKRTNNLYKSGKVFHIYRPWAEDAQKRRVWCDLQIELDNNGKPLNNTISVVIPQDFLTSATYPIYIDPTIGYTAVGGSYQEIYSVSDTLEEIVGNSYASLPSEVKLLSMSAYYSFPLGTPDIRCEHAVYSAANNTLIASTAEGLTGASGWQTLNFSPSATVSPGSGIILATWATFETSGYTTVALHYDDSAQATYMKSQEYSGTYPSPVTWDDTSTIQRTYSIYANYDPVIEISPAVTLRRGVKVLPVGFPEA